MYYPCTVDAYNKAAQRHESWTVEGVSGALDFARSLDPNTYSSIRVNGKWLF